MRSCLGVFGGAEGALGAEGSISISSSLSSESFASLYVVCVCVWFKITERSTVSERKLVSPWVYKCMKIIGGLWKCPQLSK